MMPSTYQRFDIAGGPEEVGLGQGEHNPQILQVQKRGQKQKHKLLLVAPRSLELPPPLYWYVKKKILSLHSYLYDIYSILMVARGTPNLTAC